MVIVRRITTPFLLLLLGCGQLACQSVVRPPAHRPIAIWVIGDSTAAAYPPERKPLTGWAEVLQEQFDASRVQVQDVARSGRSSKSYWDEGAWTDVRDQIRAGDYVFIQFGHNDAKRADPARFTDPDTSYKEYLKRYVDDTVSRGANPVLLTSINRNSWNANGQFADSMGDYPRAVRELAPELSVPLVDVHATTRRLFVSLGPEGTKKLFLHLAIGESPNYPEGKADDTHLNEAGARAIATLVALGVRDSCPRLRDDLK